MAPNGLQNWREEMQSAYLYEVVAKNETNPRNKKMFLGMARAARKQADIWSQAAVREGGKVPKFVPSLRTKMTARLVRWFGPKRVRMILAAMKVRGISVYSGHISETGHMMPKTLEEVGGRHRTSTAAGNIRAAVFGINDGLISNASLILGIAGANAEPSMILLAGIAGVLAGAFSMAAGEYVSVRSQREMFEYQIGLEREELKQYPREEAAELALIYEARGLSIKEAELLADKMISDPEIGLDTLAREELGFNPDDLSSPWGAATFSFLSFALGGAIPLIPFLLGRQTPSELLYGTITLTGFSLFLVGCLISLFTGRNALWSGLRMVLIGGGAGVVTFFIGRGLS